MILTTARCLADRRFLFTDDAALNSTKPRNMGTIGTDCWVDEDTIAICDLLKHYNIPGKLESESQDLWYWTLP
jgi:hypothetical protein